MIPLCVDLDGTLIKTDTSFESFLLLLKKNPFYLFLALLWLCKSRAYLKQQIATRVLPDPQHLPYSQIFLAFLHNEFTKGRKLILATGTNHKIAEQISTHLNIFSSVIASNSHTNLTGQAKSDALTAQFGLKGYDYAGNSSVDFPVWHNARNALVVNAKTSVLQKAKKIANVSHIFAMPSNRSRNFVKAIRAHQYVKNILVFIPLFVGHRDFSLTLLTNMALGFCCFCLLSSSIYLFNDLLDIEADRKNKIKQHRAFAAGELAMVYGVIFGMLFLAMGLYLSFLLPSYFTWSLASYYLVGSIYSYYFKRIFLLDVFVLATLYTVRIIAGMTIVGAGYSAWLILFALFFFLSLAFVKRYSELYDAQLQAKDEVVGRNYLVTDLSQIGLFGKISGYFSVLILALYINTERATTLYNHPKLLWIICLLLFYWITRTWLLATRGFIHQDPVIFILKDKTSLGIGFIATLIVLIATFW